MNDAAKDYTIFLDQEDGYLHVTVGGKRVTSDIALAYWREIIDKCEANNCPRILLDHDFEEMISMQEMLQVIGPVADLLKGRLLAFYDRFGNYEIPEAGKVILRSKGIKMQIFHHLDEAIKWLLAN
ncbi:MAG: hypothetical protein JO053_00060 [Acidobacteria bacterium]|nr:hypothetical protein [Acidobacteriota bacterium]